MRICPCRGWLKLNISKSPPLSDSAMRWPCQGGLITASPIATCWVCASASWAFIGCGGVSLMGFLRSGLASILVDHDPAPPIVDHGVTRPTESDHIHAFHPGPERHVVRAGVGDPKGQVNAPLLRVRRLHDDDRAHFQVEKQQFPADFIAHRLM